MLTECWCLTSTEAEPALRGRVPVLASMSDHCSWHAVGSGPSGIPVFLEQCPLERILECISGWCLAMGTGAVEHPVSL